MLFLIRMQIRVNNKTLTPIMTRILDRGGQLENTRAPLQVNGTSKWRAQGRVLSLDASTALHTDPYIKDSPSRLYILGSENLEHQKNTKKSSEISVSSPKIMLQPCIEFSKSTKASERLIQELKKFVGYQEQSYKQVKQREGKIVLNSMKVEKEDENEHEFSPIIRSTIEEKSPKQKIIKNRPLSKSSHNISLSTQISSPCHSNIKIPNLDLSPSKEEGFSNATNQEYFNQIEFLKRRASAFAAKPKEEQKKYRYGPTLKELLFPAIKPKKEEGPPIGKNKKKVIFLGQTVEMGLTVKRQKLQIIQQKEDDKALTRLKASIKNLHERPELQMRHSFTVNLPSPKKLQPISPIKTSDFLYISTPMKLTRSTTSWNFLKPFQQPEFI